MRAKLQLNEEALVVSLLPGSRAQEVSMLLPSLLDSLPLIASSLRPKRLHCVLPIAPGMRDMIEIAIERWCAGGGDAVGTRDAAGTGDAVGGDDGSATQRLSRAHFSLVDSSERYEAFAASQLALACCGTVNVELLRAGVPQVAVYTCSRLSAWLIRSVLRPSISHATLPNILLNYRRKQAGVHLGVHHDAEIAHLDEEIIPELLFERVSAGEIAASALHLLTSSDAAREQITRGQPLLEQLRPTDERGAPARSAAVAARRILELLHRQADGHT